MSAFLGPIHHWLYGKIQLQEAIIARIAAEAEAQGWSTGDKPAADYVKEETRPLDELIDTMNIHGWLQGRIHDAEGRYAQLVSALLHNNEGLLPRLEDLAREVGRDRALGADADASAIYRAFEDAFLNGMPCDRVNNVTDQNPDAFTWDQTEDLHGGLLAGSGCESGGVLRSSGRHDGRDAGKHRLHPGTGRPHPLCAAPQSGVKEACHDLCH